MSPKLVLIASPACASSTPSSPTSLKQCENLYNNLRYFPNAYTTSSTLHKYVFSFKK